MMFVTVYAPIADAQMETRKMRFSHARPNQGETVFLAAHFGYGPFYRTHLTVSMLELSINSVYSCVSDEADDMFSNR